MVLSGPCEGGPRDGIVVTAGCNWTGYMVRYPGMRYIWCECGKWVWHSVKVPGCRGTSDAQVGTHAQSRHDCNHTRQAADNHTS